MSAIFLPMFALGVIVFGAAACSTIEKVGGEFAAWMAFVGLMLVFASVFALFLRSVA